MELVADALLFDSDGVLVDSGAAVEVAWSQIAEEFDLDSARLLAELAGVRSEDTLGRYLEPAQCARAVTRLEDLEVELSPAIDPVPGAAELLQALPPERWAIVTSASARLGRARWRGAGIPAPEVIVAAEDVSEGKPSPEPYLTAARRVGVSIDRCAVFEDSASGGRAAVAAGAMVVAVGAQPWPVEPASRVPDLRGVHATPSRGGVRLVIADTSPAS